MYRFLLPLALVVSSASSIAQNAGMPDSGVAASASSTPRTAEPPGPLTLQDALRLAFAASADLLTAQHEFSAVEAAVMQAGVFPNPTLGLQVEDTRRETRETTLQLSQPFELGGKRSARVEAAERGRDAASAELNGKRADVRAAVITNFFEVLRAQERLLLAQDSTTLAQRATNAAARRVAAGKVSPVEETKARVAESGVRLELVQANSQLGSARKRLSATWGNLTPRFERAEGRIQNLPELPDLTALSARLAGAPALSRARFEVDRRQSLAQLESARRTPDVTLTLGVKRSEELGRNQAIIGVSVPLPLFDNNHGNVLESLRRTDKARAELLATEIRLDGELAQAYAHLSTSREEAIALQKEVLPGAQSAYDAATKGFEFGKFGFLDVLDAQRTLLQAKSQYLTALSEAHRAATDIDRILGEPLQAIKQ